MPHIPLPTRPVPPRERGFEPSRVAPQLLVLAYDRLVPVVRRSCGSARRARPGAASRPAGAAFLPFALGG
jgi:hypothetical protein